MTMSFLSAGPKGLCVADIYSSWHAKTTVKLSTGWLAKVNVNGSLAVGWCQAWRSYHCHPLLKLACLLTPHPTRQGYLNISRDSPYNKHTLVSAHTKWPNKTPRCECNALFLLFLWLDTFFSTTPQAPVKQSKDHTIAPEHCTIYIQCSKCYHMDPLLPLVSIKYIHYDTPLPNKSMVWWKYTPSFGFPPLNWALLVSRIHMGLYWIKGDCLLQHDPIFHHFAT